MISLQPLKTYIKNTPKGVLAIGVIGVCSLVIAILLVLSTNNNAQTDMKTATNSGNTESSREQSTDDAVTGVVVGSSTTNASAQSQPTTSTSTRANNPVSGSTSGTTPAQTTPGQQASPKADYNLNEIWYLAVATTGGLYNTCWPTALNESNEAQCADPGSIYSYPNTIFKGIGISKSAGTAQTLAANQAHEKALAQHVDPRLGGGDDAVVLTEVLCAQYSLSCGRW